MINIEDKQSCCGCHACFNVCPKNAIEMKTDEKGFLYPEIDKKKCIKCGLCLKACPIISNQEQSVTNFGVSAYSCYNNNDEERLNSSSGGLFILFAKEIIKRNGVVFGALLNDDNKVVHDYCEKINDLKMFMGSKYVQSTIGDSYKKVKEFLKKDKYVLFTGTPCQIEGLKSFLKKDYEKLYTQDIICHGVPSPLVWEKYKEYRKINDKNIPNSVSFRNKDNGWKLSNMKFTYDKFSYKKNQNEDLFMQAFLKNTILRDSCYNCSFKKMNRVSDITLADYWGVENIHPEFNDNKGTSLLIINSKKGEELFNLVSESIYYIKTDLNEAVKYNPSYITSVNADVNREKFFDNLDKVSFDKLVKNYTYKVPVYRRLLGKVKRIIKKLIKK